jgi:hypothetical protein
LPGEGFDAFVLRAQAEFNFRQRSRRLAMLALLPTAKVTPVLAGRLAGAALGPWRAACRVRGPAAFAARAAVVAPRSGRTFAARRARTTAITVAAAFGALSFALVVGVFGGGRLLRPGGQKEFVQIEFAIR